MPYRHSIFLEKPTLNDFPYIIFSSHAFSCQCPGGDVRMTPHVGRFLFVCLGILLGFSLGSGLPVKLRATLSLIISYTPHTVFLAVFVFMYHFLFHPAPVAQSISCSSFTLTCLSKERTKSHFSITPWLLKQPVLPPSPHSPTTTT